MAEHAESGPPPPRLSSTSNRSSSNPIGIRENGATIVSPRSPLGADSRRTVSSSGGRGGSTRYQLDPRAPIFHTSERSPGQHSYPVASDISSTTRAFSEVTLCDSQVAKGHSDCMTCSTTVKLQLIRIGYPSRSQEAQKIPSRSTNVPSQTETISHGARIQRRKISPPTS